MRVNTQTTALFSEAGQEWRPLPPWVEFLTRLGYRWPNDATAPRRIALVSMPCDSAGAGLVALGVLVRDLGNPNANEIDGHYDALLRYARQYLAWCRSCDMQCRPAEKDCGFAAMATGRIKSLRKPCTGYMISEETDFGKRQIAFSRRGETTKPIPGFENRVGANYYVNGESPPEVHETDGALPGEPYASFADGMHIEPENLRRSFSGLCLAGRVAGGAATRDICSTVRLRTMHGEQMLSELLTVHGWCLPSLVSRVTFYNTRTRRFDRGPSEPALVVADGDGAFLEVLGSRAFQRADVIGIIHRTLDREDLEAVGTRLLGLRQWYDEDRELHVTLPTMPRGISVAVLRKRTH